MNDRSKLHYESVSDEQLSSFLNQLHFKVNSFGLWDSNKGEKMRYASDDFVILYFVKGKIQTTIGTKQYDCPENSILVLEPYALNTFVETEDYAYYYLQFEVEPYHLQNPFLDMLIKNGNLLYPNEFRDFREMFDRLLLEVKAAEIGYTTIILSGLIRVLVEIIRAQYRRSPTQYSFTKVDSPYVNAVNDAIRYVQRNLCEPVKLEKIAKELGVSTSYLYKSFHKVVKMSPTQYFQQYKIKWAQKLLLQQYRVNDIASRLGYSSAYHLSRVFKEQTGLSPRAYQKQIRNH